MVNDKASVRRGPFRQALRQLFGKTPGSVAFNLILYTLFLVLAVVMLYPFLFVVLESIKSVIPTDSGVPQYTYNLSAYVYVFTQVDGLMWSFFWSLFVAGTATVLHVFCVMLTAYPLTKKQLKGRTAFLLFILFTMLFNGGMIPYYLLMQDLHLMNNPLIYFLPGLVSGFDIIIAKNFLSGIPESLAESAQLDGASEYRIFFSIYLPMSWPIMATLALWSFVGKWNDWMTGLLYMQKSPNLQLIQTFLRRILNAATTQTGGVADSQILNLSASIRMAIIVVGMLPIVLMYPCVQKHFVKGVMLGSVKG